MVIVVSSIMLRLMCLSCNSLRVLENLYFSLGKDELGALCTFCERERVGSISYFNLKMRMCLLD